MSRERGASVRQRRVSAELRALREARGLTCQEVADAMDCSVSKISRIETGFRGMFPDDVAAILGYLQAPSKLREELMQLIRDSDKPNWIQVGGILPKKWKTLLRLETEATAIYNYEPQVVPGLLQTADYARTLLGAVVQDYAEGAIDHLVRTRMGRQAVLSRFMGPHYFAIVDEMVLRRPVGALGVMHGQLQHLLNMAERQQVEIRVVPFSVGANPGLEGPALILEFADQPTVVYVEVRAASGFVEEKPEILRVRVAWRDLLSMSLSPEDSARLIAEIADGLPTHQEAHDAGPEMAQEQL